MPTGLNPATAGAGIVVLLWIWFWYFLWNRGAIRAVIAELTGRY